MHQADPWPAVLPDGFDSTMTSETPTPPGHVEIGIGCDAP